MPKVAAEDQASIIDIIVIYQMEILKQEGLPDVGRGANFAVDVKCVDMSSPHVIPELQTPSICDSSRLNQPTLEPGLVLRTARKGCLDVNVEA